VSREAGQTGASQAAQEALAAPLPAPPIDEEYAVGEAGNRVIRGGSLRVAGSMAGVVAGVISAPLVVRHLGVANYGHYLTVASVIFVVASLTEGGLANIAVRMFSVGDDERRRSLIGNLTGLRIALGAFGAVAAVGFGVLVGYEHRIVIGLVLGAVGYVLGGIQGSYSVALSGRLRLSALAGIDVLRSLTTTVLLVSLVFAGSGLVGFYAVAAVVQALALVATAVLVRGEVPLLPAFRRTVWLELLRETALYAAAVTLGAIYFQVALITMSLLDPGPQTGYYAISFRIVEIINGIPWLLAASVLPVLSVAASTDRARLGYVAGRVFEGALIAGAWVALIVVVGAEFGIHVIAGTKGNPSIPVLRIMAIGVPATYLVSSWGYVLLSLRKYVQLVAANASALLLAMLLSALLIPALHARGGAITTVVLELWLAGAYIVFLSRQAIVPPRAFLARFALAVALGLLAGGALLQAHAGPVVEVVAVAVASAVYFAALWFLRAIPSELIDAVPWRR